jgi:hypothetical protein
MRSRVASAIVARDDQEQLAVLALLNLDCNWLARLCFEVFHQLSRHTNEPVVTRWHERAQNLYALNGLRMAGAAAEI